jgi:plasmid stabilization system protein ParE
MTYTLGFLSQIEADVRNAREWYEAKTPGLGKEFVHVFYESAGELVENPQLHSRIYRDFRRRLLRRFPYAIYFRIEDERVVVFGVFHCARDLRRLQRELRNRP